MSYIVSEKVKKTIDTLLANEKVRKAMDFLVQDQPNRTEENKEIALVQGESRKEYLGRSPLFKKLLERYGAKDCGIDEVGNTFGYIYGAGRDRKPLVLMESHLDSVFLASTPLAIVEKDGKIFCPGIGDNASSMAQTLSILRAVRHAGLVPVGTIVPLGAVCEEGSGNLDGMRFFLKDRKDIDAAVIVDGGGSENIYWGAIGIKRFTITYSGPQGHSWLRAGLPSTIHAMARGVAKIADIPMILDPKTTINVGIVEGGSTVGAIAGRTMIQVDLRSASARAMAELEEKVMTAIAAGVAEENEFKKGQPAQVTYTVECFGDMPAGEGLADHEAVQAAYYLTEVLGKTPVMQGGGCTNGNIPVDKGIPMVVIGHGGFNGENHSLNEWYEPLDNYMAAQRALLTVFALAGLEGVTEPLI